MNIQSINWRINIAKRIIRSSKRERRNERQHKATKYFTLKPSVKQSSITWTIHFIKQKNLRQLLIHPFLSSDTNISKSGRNLQTVPLSRWTNIVFHQRKTILNSTTMLAKESSSQLQPSLSRAPIKLKIPLISNTSYSVIPIKDTVTEEQQTSRNEGNLDLN